MSRRMHWRSAIESTTAMAVLTVAGQDLIKSARPCTSPCEDAPWIWEDATSLGFPPIMATTAWAAVGVADGLEELSMNPTRTVPPEGGRRTAVEG